MSALRLGSTVQMRPAMVFDSRFSIRYHADVSERQNQNILIRPVRQKPGCLNELKI